MKVKHISAEHFEEPSYLDILKTICLFSIKKTNKQTNKVSDFYVCMYV